MYGHSLRILIGTVFQLFRVAKNGRVTRAYNAGCTTTSAVLRREGAGVGGKGRLAGRGWQEVSDEAGGERGWRKRGKRVSRQAGRPAGS